jgi:probable addiction module antidote protein
MTDDFEIPVKIIVTPWDSAALIKSDEDAIGYLNAALEENDPELLAHALGVIAKARGMTQVAKDAGINRQNLYRSLGGGAAVELGTALRVMAALGIKLTASRADQAAA